MGRPLNIPYLSVSLFDQEPAHTKIMHVNLCVKYFDMIRTRRKTSEMRANVPFWRARLRKATHISFMRGRISHQEMHVGL